MPVYLTRWDSPAFFVDSSVFIARDSRPMTIGKKSWFAFRVTSRRAVRTLIVWLMTLLLCSATHGAAAHFVVSSLAFLGAEDIAEKTASEEETRDTSPKLVQNRVSCARDPIVCQTGLSALTTVRRRLTSHQSVYLSTFTDCQGAGIRIRC